MTGPTTISTSEREDLLQALEQQRFLLRRPLRDLTDEQVASRPTVSELSLGGLVKHVASTEQTWVSFLLEGASAFPAWDDASAAAHRQSEFEMATGETLADVALRYETVADRTREVVQSLPDLDVSQLLPAAPWFEPDARWTARRVLVHVLAETAQHAGHADILREAIDGAKSMG